MLSRKGIKKFPGLNFFAFLSFLWQENAEREKISKCHLTIPFNPQRLSFPQRSKEINFLFFARQKCSDVVFNNIKTEIFAKSKVFGFVWTCLFWWMKQKKNVNRICEKTCLTGSVLSLADDWFGEHSSTSTQKYPVLIYHEFWNWFRVIMKRGPRQSSEKSDHNNIKCTQTMHHNRRVRFRQHLWFLITRKKYCDKTMMMMTMKKTKQWADGRGGGVKDRSMLKCIANIMQMLTLTRISSQISKYISFFTYRRKKNNRHTQTVHFFLSIRYVIRTYHNLK